LIGAGKDKKRGRKKKSSIKTFPPQTYPIAFGNRHVFFVGIAFPNAHGVDDGLCGTATNVFRWVGV
jgi:hypothetical protein